MLSWIGDFNIMAAAAGPNRSHRRTICIAVGLVIFDGLFFCSGGILCLVSVGLMFYLPFLFIRFFKKKDRVELMFHLKNVAIYIAAMGVVLGIVEMNNDRIRSRTKNLILAVNSFHKKCGRYPDNLNRLVPDFIEKVPSEVSYSNYTDEAFIVDWSRPPFYGAKRYRFSTGKWDRFD
jgi:hypothetical protein